HKHVSFVIADLPGLIEGAAEGKGLGVQFLRHTERTRVLIHLVDPAGYMGQDPVSGVKTIENELKTFSAKLTKEPRILVVNKMDLPEGEEVFKAIKKKYPKARVMAASVATGDGIDAILDRVIELLASSDGPVHFEDKVVDETLHKVEQGFTIANQGGGYYRLSGKYVERVSAMLDVSLPEAIQRYQNTLRRIGVDRALKKAGIQPGDKVRCGEFEFEWKNDLNRKQLPIKRGDKRTRIGVGKK
ncbi:MAG: Obg family GTPase CgtA, partial [Elusimicrobiota bacterium]